MMSCAAAFSIATGIEFWLNIELKSQICVEIDLIQQPVDAELSAKLSD